MQLQEMSDSEILDIAGPILRDIVTGSNQKNWTIFSKHMPEEDVNDQAVRAEVEQQWQDNEYLTSLSEKNEFLGVIRKTDSVLVLWKQTSAKSDDEFLQKLYLHILDGEIKQLGTWIE